MTHAHGAHGYHKLRRTFEGVLSRSKRPGETLQVGCILVVALWTVSPPLAYNTLARVAALAAAVLWAAVELSTRPSTFFRPTAPTLCAMVFTGYTAIVNVATDGTQGVVRVLGIYIFLFYLVVHESFRRRDIRKLRVVLWPALALQVVWAAITLRAIGDQRNVARLITRSDEVAAQLASEGVGGFGLVYSTLVTIPILLSLAGTSDHPPALKGRRRLVLYTVKALIIAAAALGIVLVLKAGFTIALLLLGLMVAVTLVLGNGNAATIPRLGLTILLLLLFIPLLFDLDGLGRIIHESVTGSSYEQKVEDLGASFHEGPVGTFEDRVERYSRSLRLFGEHPFLGTLSFDGAGKHSAILDQFARYGAVFGGAFLCCVVIVPVRYVARLKRVALGGAFATFVGALGVCTLNNVFPALGFALFVFYPLVATLHFDQSAMLSDVGETSW